MTALMRFLKKIDDILFLVQKIIILISVVCIIVINGAQIFCRYVIHSSIFWSEQVSLVLFLIIIMLGANIAVKDRTETQIDLMKFKNQKANESLNIVKDIICLVALVVLMFSGVALMKQTIKFPQYLSSIHMNYNYIYIWLLIGFGLITFDKVINLLKSICYLTGVDLSSVYPDETADSKEEIA